MRTENERWFAAKAELGTGGAVPDAPRAVEVRRIWQKRVRLFDSRVLIGLLAFKLCFFFFCAVSIELLPIFQVEVFRFAWNELWTFCERTVGRSAWRSRGSRLIKFNLICSGGILIAVMTLRLLVERFGANLYVANFLAIVAATSWNFGINYTYNWRTAFQKR